MWGIESTFLENILGYFMRRFGYGDENSKEAAVFTHISDFGNRIGNEINQGIKSGFILIAVAMILSYITKRPSKGRWAFFSLLNNLWNDYKFITRIPSKVYKTFCEVTFYFLLENLWLSFKFALSASIEMVKMAWTLIGLIFYLLKLALRATATLIGWSWNLLKLSWKTIVICTCIYLGSSIINSVLTYIFAQAK